MQSVLGIRQQLRDGGVHVIGLYLNFAKDPVSSVDVLAASIFSHAGEISFSGYLNRFVWATFENFNFVHIQKVPLHLRTLFIFRVAVIVFGI